MAAPGETPDAWAQEVLEAAPVPVVIYGADRTVEYVNQAAVEFANAADEDAVLGTGTIEFVHPADRARIADRLTRVLDDREPVPAVEARFVALDGETKHAEVAGVPITFDGELAGQAVLNDVTDRRRNAQQLRQERDRFELLFENLPNPVVHGEAVGGEPIVRDVNERFEAVFGYDHEEIAGKNLDEYIVPADRREATDRLNRRILTEGRLQAEVERETVDGRREFLLNIVLAELDTDRPEGYAIYTDITDRRAAKRELERQNERLEDFASMVAHDLRNPLSIASLHAEDLQSTTDADLEPVVEHLDRMERIIDGLLELTRQGGPVEEPAPVDLAALSRRAWAQLETGETDLRLDEPPTVLADEESLLQLLTNLFQNAVEHTDDDGVVTVSDTDDGFAVADNGPGLSPSEREQVFDPGYSATDDGIGYGLTIVEHIAEAHGWEIAVVESDAGGASFRFSEVGEVG